MQIQIDPAVLAELNYIVKLHVRHGAPNPMSSVEELVGYVLSSVADGSRRPGSWEREFVERMGLIADTPVHELYRAQPGEPPAT